MRGDLQAALPIGRPIHQIVSRLEPGDAVGNECLAIQARLQAAGHPSLIFADHINPLLVDKAQPMERYFTHSGRDHTVIWHFSIGDEIFERVARLPDRVVMRYHNITPAHFFHDFNRQAEAQCRLGRRQLAAAAEFVDLGLACSDYSRLELEELGYRRTVACPIILDHRPVKPTSPPNIIREAGPGPLVLHVGRISPQKNYEAIFKTWRLLQRLNPEAKLAIAGRTAEGEPYYEFLKKLIDRLELERVIFCDFVPAGQLEALYRRATVYLCLSEHEGFCVPLIQAMKAGLAVVAKDAAAIGETLGTDGVLLESPTFGRIAETVNLLLTDPELRQEVVQAQYRRVERFEPDRVWTEFANLVDPGIRTDADEENGSSDGPERA